MPMSASDRQTFSGKIAAAPAEIAVYQQAQVQLAAAVAQLQSLDTANKNLFDPVNAKVNLYQTEISILDGNTRTTIVEQDIQDASAVKIGNHFYPNQTNVTVPSLASANNVWTKANPYALGYAIGKNYSEAYATQTSEQATLTSILTLIASIAANTNGDIGNTTGESVSTPAPTGTPPVQGTPTLGPDATVQANKTSLVTLVNTLVGLLNSQSTAITAENAGDTNATNQSNNTAAKTNITGTILPALNTWLAYPDFNTTGVTATNFASYNAALLAPTKLYSVQLNALKAAITARQTFVTTRLGQLNTVLGSITQSLADGSITASSGLYGQRYNFLILRLHLLNGSLCKMASMNQAAGAQTSIISSINSAAQTYGSILPTTLLAAPGNGTATISVNDASSFAVGDTVYLVSDTQTELLRAIKSISGNSIVLNDVIPTKYVTTDNLRMYKDLS